jgi:DNA-binding HxlR family transcriptional regulator
MARRTSVAHFPCSIARTLDVVGDWWTLLVVRDVSLGLHRFDQIQENLGIARNVLTERLHHLVDEGILRREPYQEHPERFEYRLTSKGDDLFGILMALWAWGDEHEAGPEGPPLALFHRPSTAAEGERGHVCHPQVVCSTCGERLRRRRAEVAQRPT